VRTLHNSTKATHIAEGAAYSPRTEGSQFIPDSEVESDLVADPYVFVRDSSLRYAPFRMTSN
jgi:hypothetical protein